MNPKASRRKFIKDIGTAAAGFGLASSIPQFLHAATYQKKLFFTISLAEFSFASDFWQGKFKNTDFAAKAKNDFGIEVIEYVSMFFAGKEGDAAYLKELKQRSDDLGVKNHLIMVDASNISDLDEAKRKKAVTDHHKWVDVAKTLGCSAIRVNLGSMDMPGSSDDEAKAAVDGYGRLLEYGKQTGINILAENHMGRSCNGQWLAGVMKQVNHPNAGTLIDFANFCVRRTKPETNDIAGWMGTKCLEEYDRYKGVAELLPYAKGVSAKTHKFDAAGNDIETDFNRMMKLVKESGFKGYIGIEYEGGLMQAMAKDNSYLSNDEGVRATKKLLEKSGAVLS